MLLASLMLFSLCACGFKKPLESAPEETVAPQSTPVPKDVQKIEKDIKDVPQTPEEVAKILFAYKTIYELQTARGVDVEGCYTNHLNEMLAYDCGGSFDEFKDKALKGFPDILEEGWFDFSGSGEKAKKLMGNDAVGQYREKIESADSAEALIAVLVEAKLAYDYKWFASFYPEGEDPNAGTEVTDISKRELAGDELKSVLDDIKISMSDSKVDGWEYLFFASDIEKIYAMSFLVQNAEESYQVTEDDCIFVVQTPKGCFFASVV